MIEIDVSAELSCEGRPPTADRIERSVKLCVSNAVDGSFDDYPAHFNSQRRFQAALVSDEVKEKKTCSEVRFTFGVPTELFPAAAGGMQLLVSLLAGDVFPTEALGCTWSNVNVHSLKLPEEMRADAFDAFRMNAAHSISDIRAAFELPPERPLLAYSLKPRVGLNFEEMAAATLEILDAGFNIVELDARNIALHSASLERWVQLGKQAAETGRHVTAFSPNLSIPAPQLPDAVHTWTEKIGPSGPPVVKIDGGLDALSSLQAVRLAKKEQSWSRTPIITTYPILRNQLRPAIGESTWVDFLSLSGADIIYPGGRPTFPKERRPVWGGQAQGLSRAARVYDDMISRGWPMPTIAGGVQPGQLQACYELLGPNAAYFLGGAVALHPDGAAAGAKLCLDVLKYAIDRSHDAQESGSGVADDIPVRLIQKIEETPYPNMALMYHSPANIFGVDDESRPWPFHQRPGHNAPVL